MDFITVVVIGLVIYSLIKKVNKKIQPGSTISDREVFTGRDSLTLLKEMLEQYKEIQDPQQIREIERKISYGKRLKTITAEGEAGVEGVWAETAVSKVEGTSGYEGIQGIEGTSGYEGIQGIEGTSGYEGIQGIEGTSGYEGIQGIEGTSGYEGIQGIEGTSGYEGIQGIEGTPGQRAQAFEVASGFLNPDFYPNKQELLQGIIWAEVLGRPRALRSFRSTR
ncbi:MAG: hypothetical protein PHZ11_08210 [Desulfitobacteriaceae bacterium]|nr:hypothetical protein [Desulfitobacteriaceae bacterium]MDD4346851.1 hypothetical protein [Desulfitobacteriaceae bacterium]MDD4402240.1 hypothetical protein [Desulfitobacteriaceae bacterium]